MIFFLLLFCRDVNGDIALQFDDTLHLFYDQLPRAAETGT